MECNDPIAYTKNVNKDFIIGYQFEFQSVEINIELYWIILKKLKIYNNNKSINLLYLCYILNDLNDWEHNLLKETHQ